MKGIKITIDDIKTTNNFEMTKLILKVIILSKNIYLSDTQLNVLCHFIIDGYTPLVKEDILNVYKYFKSKKQLDNCLSLFRRMGIIVKKNYGEEVNSDYSSIQTKNLDLVRLEIDIKKQ